MKIYLFHSRKKTEMKIAEDKKKFVFFVEKKQLGQI